jgi:hypothetical protein
MHGAKQDDNAVSLRTAVIGIWTMTKERKKALDLPRVSKDRTKLLLVVGGCR